MPSPPLQSFTVHDSAGVSIAESADSAWTAATAWRVDPTPFLRIGSIDGNPPGTDFSGAFDALTLPDGRIVVVERSASELRVFDQSGRLLQTLGRRGDGPGEFGRIGSVGLVRGDSLVVEDEAAYRFTIFAPDGSVRIGLLPRPGQDGFGPLGALGWLTDGSFLVEERPSLAQLPSGPAVQHFAWHLFDPDGRHVREVARLPVTQHVDRNQLMFGPRYAVHLAANGFWYGFPEQFELRYFTASGLTRIVRRPWVREAVSAEARDVLIRQVRGDVSQLSPSQLQAREAAITQLVFADSLPAFGSVMSSTDGHLWVQTHPTASDLSAAGAEWDSIPAWNNRVVFSPQGAWLGTVEMPHGMTIGLREIGADYVMGWVTGEFDVPYLVLHRIIKP